MYQSNRIQFNTLASIDTATFTGSYQLLGVFAHPVRILKILNNSNVDVTVSDDGINDKDFVPAVGFTLYDFGTNKGMSADALDLKAGAIYVKGSVGTGLVYLVTLSAVNPTMNIPGI